MSIAVTLCHCLSAILLSTSVERAFSQSGLFDSWTWYFYQIVVVMAPVTSAKCLGTSRQFCFPLCRLRTDRRDTWCLLEGKRIIRKFGDSTFNPCK